MQASEFARLAVVRCFILLGVRLVVVAFFVCFLSDGAVVVFWFSFGVCVVAVAEEQVAQHVFEGRGRAEVL